MPQKILINDHQFAVSNCITCGVTYTVPWTQWLHQKEWGGYHHCSNGHSQGWSTEDSEVERTRRERDRLKQAVAQREDETRHERQLRKMAERSASAYKGQVTKLKRRAKAGVCPCCSRHFTNLERHMASKHPDMNPEEPLKVIEGGKV